MRGSQGASLASRSPSSSDTRSGSATLAWSRASGAGCAAPLERRLAARLGGALHSHRASLSRPDVLAGLACESAAWFAQEAPRRDLDPRVASVVEALRDPDADRHRVLARTRLSAAHLQALFVRDVGVPIRTYLLWRRLLIAIASCVRLDNTNAAHFAGFSDLAHLSRTCRRMLGYSPTRLRREFVSRYGLL